MYVRLTRVGNVFTDYWSTDGVTFNTVGSQTLAMGSVSYVGLMAMADNQAPATFTYANLAGLPATPANVPSPEVLFLSSLAVLVAMTFKRKNRLLA